MKQQRGPSPEPSAQPLIRIRVLQPTGPARVHALLHGIDLLIGRGSDADIAIEDVRVSRRHCQLFWHQGHLHLLDVGSSNGTRLNDLTVTQRQRVYVGDTIAVGDATIRIEQGERRRRARPPLDPRRSQVTRDRVRSSTLTATRNELRELWWSEQRSNPILIAILGAQPSLSLIPSAEGTDPDVVFAKIGRTWEGLVNSDGLVDAARKVIAAADLTTPREDLEYVEAATFLKTIVERFNVLDKLATLIAKTHLDWLDFPERHSDLGQLELRGTAMQLGVEASVLERVSSRTWAKTPDGQFALRSFFRVARGWAAPTSEERTMVSPPPLMVAATAPPSKPVRTSWPAALPALTQRVFTQLARHGAVTEAEVTEMLGGPREHRNFARQLDQLTQGAPFRVRVEFVNGVKRYVKESTG